MNLKNLLKSLCPFAEHSTSLRWPEGENNHDRYAFLVLQVTTQEQLKSNKTPTETLKKTIYSI